MSPLLACTTGVAHAWRQNKKQILSQADVESMNRQLEHMIGGSSAMDAKSYRGGLVVRKPVLYRYGLMSFLC